jgi:hypothetical protein
MRMRRLVAVVLLLALWSMAALAQTVGQSGRQVAGPSHRDANGVLTSTSAGPPVPMLVGGTVRADTTIQDIAVTAEGYVKTSEASPLFSNYRTGELINNQVTASGVFMADSNTAPVQSYDLKRIGLTFFGTFDSLSTVVRIAVQVRSHFNLNTDSLSTFPWYRWANAGGIPGGAGAGMVKTDSIGHASLLAMSQVPLTAVQATAANSANGGLLPGEFEVIFNLSRSDTTAAGNGKPFSAPTGIYVPLVGPLGEWFWAPYFSVRVRVLNGVRSRFRIRVNYAGTSL